MNRPKPKARNPRTGEIVYAPARKNGKKSRNKTRYVDRNVQKRGPDQRDQLTDQNQMSQGKGEAKVAIMKRVSPLLGLLIAVNLLGSAVNLRADDVEDLFHFSKNALKPLHTGEIVIHEEDLPPLQAIDYTDLNKSAHLEMVVQTPHTGNIGDLRFSTDGRYYLSSSADRSVKLWTKDSRLVRTFPNPDESGSKIAYLPDGKRFYSITSKCIYLWSLADETYLAKYDPKFHQESFTSLASLEDGSCVAGTDNGRIFVFAEDFQNPNSFVAHQSHDSYRSVVAVNAFGASTLP
jgi:hypothetical protein